MRMTKNCMPRNNSSRLGPGLFINRWFLSLVVALVVLDSGAQAYRYYKRMGNRFRPVIMRPMPVGRFGFVRAENPNADGAMDAKSGEESSEPAPLPPQPAPQAPAMDDMPMHEMHAPQMREMIHDSPHPVEIDMGPGMQARVMGFEGELDEGNFGRAAGEDEEENEGEEGGQFRHFKHKHKKHKYVIHTHHHYHHKKGGHEGYGHHGYGHGKHGGYGHHGGHGGGHGYGHDDGGEGDDYEPTYGHHGRYRRSSMSESSPADELAPDTPQALDRTALPTHSSPDHPIPLAAGPTTMVDPGAPGTVYRQSVSRRQLVRSKNERLAKIGRDRAQRANRLRSMAKRMIEGLEGGRTGQTTGEGVSVATGEGSVPQRWLHKRRTKSEWRRRDANAGRRRRPMPMEKVIERRTPEDVPFEVPTTVITPAVPAVETETEEKEMEKEKKEDVECDDQICSNFYVDERKITTTSTTPREPEYRLEDEFEPKLAPFGNEIDQAVNEEASLATFIARPREEPKSHRNSLWRGLSKRLSAFRERQADRGARRKSINPPEQQSTTTVDPVVDDDEYDSNEIVEYYQQQDVGRVLYRMANGRLLEEPQRLHLRRSAEGDEEGDPNSLRSRRLNRLSNRLNRRRKPAKSNAASDPQPAEGTIDKSRTPMINIGTFRLTDPKYEGAASAPAPAAATGLENIGAARSASGYVSADMDNYIMQKVREYCSTSCAAGKSHPPPVIIMPSAVAPASASNNEPIVGSSKQLIVQPPSTYEAATVAPATARTSAPNTPACPTKIVKCIPKAMAGSGKRSRKTDSSGKSSSSNNPADEKESNPLVSLARGSMTPFRLRHYRFNPFRRFFGPFSRL
ncbi:uncharacterized protein LOC126565671 [Anopheles maculipalpis]|uniref:uncharacterized protein LOC126565671 n=1 Tax=Anopheles maculipalpis TaxID=1496333 RepID=UPI0021594B37|nr:uncharacterized protein LOC126565671 [Anopheles maculipalpis]